MEEQPLTGTWLENNTSLALPRLRRGN